MLGKSKKKKTLPKKNKKEAMDKQNVAEQTKEPQYLFDTKKLQDLSKEVNKETEKVEPTKKEKKHFFRKKKKVEVKIQEDEIEKVDLTDSIALDDDVQEPKKKSRNKKKPLTLRTTNALCAFILALSTLFVYYFSNDSKVRVLACEGNYYYTDSQIYKMAHITKETRLWLVPSTLMETQISHDGLIDRAKVKKTSGKISINVSEKFAIGYYIEDGTTYILTIDGDAIEVKDEYKENLIHLPLISGFTKKQRLEICSRLKEKENKLSHDVIEKISEIVPFTSSYDENMIEFIMRDGNSVFSSLDSLSMLVKYTAVLTKLKGTSACLVLDSSHNAVDKINCEDITTQRKNLLELQTACEADGNEWDKTTNSCTIKEKEEVKEENEEVTEEQESVDGSQEENPEEENSGSGELISYLETVTDWQLDESSGLMISYTAGYYYNQYTGTYYTWDDTTASFRELTNEDTLNY